VASVEALNLLYQAMHAVAYRRIATAIRLASKVGVCFIVIVLYVTPTAAREIQSKYLPNSIIALNLLHWVMHLVLSWRICRAIETASKVSVFVFTVNFLPVQNYG
jgi:hypothetical protein